MQSNVNLRPALSFFSVAAPNKKGRQPVFLAVCASGVCVHIGCLLEFVSECLSVMMCGALIALLGIIFLSKL